ncbi:hypothetical protein O3P69_007674 [Scylla paramamosain]|uniref:Uncharacterized protein n=1 Tax=Scylla paramamosain TaxID=85552 RepID=A0AAW0UY12_SCYPA
MPLMNTADLYHVMYFSSRPLEYTFQRLTSALPSLSMSSFSIDLVILVTLFIEGSSSYSLVDYLTGNQRTVLNYSPTPRYPDPSATCTQRAELSGKLAASVTFGNVSDIYVRASHIQGHWQTLHASLRKLRLVGKNESIDQGRCQCEFSHKASAGDGDGNIPKLQWHGRRSQGQHGIHVLPAAWCSLRSGWRATDFN